MYLLGDRGGLCIAQHGSFNWEKPGLRFLLNSPCITCAANGRWFYGSLSLDVLLKSCPSFLLSMIGGTYPAQDAKQIPLIRQVYAEAQRQLPIGDPACDRC